MTTDVAAAEETAAQAQADVGDAEQRIQSGTAETSEGRLVELVTRARHAELAAEGARQQAARDRRAARLKSLEDLGTEIDEAAAGSGAAIAAALTDMARAASRARAAAAVHDRHVADLAAAASALGCQEPAPGGPRAADGHVSVRRGSVQHGETLLTPATDLQDALQLAMAGDAVSALAAVKTTRHVPTPERAELYVRGVGGVVHAIHGGPNSFQIAQLSTGDLVKLTEAEIRAYVAGDTR